MNSIATLYAAGAALDRAADEIKALQDDLLEVAGSAFRAEPNRQSVEEAFDRIDGDLRDITDAVRRFVRETRAHLAAEGR